MILPVLATIAAIAWAAIAAYGPPKDGLGWSVLVLFVLAMAWQAVTAWQAIHGLIATRLGDRATSALERRSATIAPRASGLSRTAAVIAVHADDPIAVFAALRVMARSLRREGGDGSDIDLFVISDTREGAISAVEEHEFNRIRAWAEAQGPGLPRIRYRRRAAIGGGEAGIIADFCSAHGHDYDFMITLDADSLMSGATMRRLARLMEEHAGIGLIQTVSSAAGRDTLFARIQHFAMRLHAPLALRGLDRWQGPDGASWGHNAILRIAALSRCRRLPAAGGETGRYDRAVGALLRKSGWEVRLLPDMGGSWAAMPATLTGLIGRDPRSCRSRKRVGGEPMPGLAYPSSCRGISAIPLYAAYPAWAAFLVLGTIQAARTGELGLLGYGLTGFTPAAWILAALVVATMALPKLLSLADVLASPERLAGFGGRTALLKSAALEQLAWVMLWPVMAFAATRSVLMGLAGPSMRRDARRPGGHTVSWREALWLQAEMVIAGLVLAALLAYASIPSLALWMAPVALALILSPVLSVLTSRSDLGERARAHGWFLTTDDAAQVPELAALQRYRQPATSAARPPLRPRAGSARAPRIGEPRTVVTHPG